MIIVYKPEDGEARRWDLKKAKVLSTEAEAVEKVTDATWPQVKANLFKGSISALRAVAWILAKRDEPTLRHRAFNPPEDELDFEFDAEERAALREEIEKSDELTDDQRAQALAELADPESDEDVPLAGDEGPKDQAEDTCEPLPEASPPTVSPVAA